MYLDLKGNILEYYQQNNKRNSLFMENEKWLLSNNIIKTEEKTKEGYIFLTKNKVKNRIYFIKICAIVLKYLNGGNYIIKINVDYEAYNIFNNEIYCVNFLLLYKCDENLRNQYYKLIEINNIHNDNEENNSIISSDDDNDLYDKTESENMNWLKINIKPTHKNVKSY